MILHIDTSVKKDVNGVEVYSVTDDISSQIILVYFEVGDRKLYLQKDDDWKDTWGEAWNARMFIVLDSAEEAVRKYRAQGIPARLLVYAVSHVEPKIEL